MTDPLVAAVDELVDGQAATVGVLDERLAALVDAFAGTQMIAGRDGRPGRDGRDGRDGEPGQDGHNGAVVFVDRSFLERRLAEDSRDGVRRVYIGRAFNGTDERARGWYIERTSLTANGVLVETTQSGMVSWSSRLSADYELNPVKTAALRAAMIDTPTMLGVVEEAEAAGSLPANDARALRRILTSRVDEFIRLVEGWSPEPA